MSGDKWYTTTWKSIVNKGKKAKYWVEKNFGSIKSDLALYHEKAYTEYTESVLEQAKKSIEEIFKKIKDTFCDESADNNIICKLNPGLDVIRCVIRELNRDIEELDNKKQRIERELVDLNYIFSNVK